MPIYEYQCKSCHHQFDLMQKIHDAPVTQCPQCFENTVIKMVSAAGFQLKGTGWYATDFKNKSNSTKETSTNTNQAAQGSDTSSKDNSSSTTESTASVTESTASTTKTAKGDSE